MEKTVKKFVISFLIKKMTNHQKNIMKFGKVKNNIKKEFDSKPVYNGKYLKGKMKSYNGKININFLNNKISKECSKLTYLSVILINVVFRTGKYYYPRVFLEECKHVVK